MIAPGGEFTFAPRADHVARAILVSAKKRAAALHALGHARFSGIKTVRGTAGITGDTARGEKRFVVVGAIPIGAPLPDVARQIVKAVAIRRKLRDRRDARE